MSRVRSWVPVVGLLLLGTGLSGGCGDPTPRRAAHKAVAALAAGDADTARAEAEAAESAGGEAFTGFRYFVRGNAAWAASREWEQAARAGDPEAMKVAQAQAEDALAYWQMAAASRRDWPAARRNVERGLRRLQALRESRTERTPPPENERTPDPEDTTPEDEETPEASEALVERGDLPADRVGSLLEVLLRRDARKRALRREQRRSRGTSVERDW